MRKVQAPTLIVQGQSDTLFNLNEGIANYRALKAQGTPTKMIWMNGGHSGPAAPGELETGSPDPTTQYVTARIADWLDHYLKGAAVDTGPEFSYFRDWVSYTGIATPAYADSPTYPVGTPKSYYLSGSKLVTDPVADRRRHAELPHASGRAPDVLRRARRRPLAPAAAHSRCRRRTSPARSPPTRRRRTPPTSTWSGRRSSR